MELTVPFKKSDFTATGEHKPTGKLIFELQQEWEELYHYKFNPLYANVIEGHPSAMQRLTQYFEPDDSTRYDFGMELIDGEIDIDTNLEIDKHTQADTVYAIGSRLQPDEDGFGLPVFLIKNDKLKDNILVLRYDPEDDENEDFLSVSGPSGSSIPCTLPSSGGPL